MSHWGWSGLHWDLNIQPHGGTELQLKKQQQQTTHHQIKQEFQKSGGW